MLGTATPARADWIAACLLCAVALIGGCSKDAPAPPPQVVDVTERLAPRPEVPDSR